MARISGVDIPDNKTPRYALRAIYGIGATHAQEIVEKAEGPEDHRRQQSLIGLLG